jgi:putative ABC transport system permease protein
VRYLAAVSFEALSRYRLRTALSVLGVMLGVAAVVAMVCVGQGAREEALRQVAHLGMSNLVVRFRAPASDGTAASSSAGLTAADLERLRRLAPLVANASPLVERPVEVSGPAGRERASVLGVAADYFAIFDLDTVTGRRLTELDDARAARVCVLSSDLAGLLFGAGGAVGQSISLDGVLYTIAGVLEPRDVGGGETGAISTRSLERVIFVPLGALVAHELGQDPWTRLTEIWVRVNAANDPSGVGRVVERTLSAVRPAGNDFEVIVPKELLSQRVRLRRTFDVIVGAVAVATLLVGGIGVMNVMLTAVLERTQEIGLRRAVGATQRSIASQFLFEAVAIASFGGAVGLLLGLAAAWSIGVFAGWPVVVSPTAAVAALGLSVGTGVLSGVYPARRAAALAPIEAVRYE